MTDVGQIAGLELCSYGGMEESTRLLGVLDKFGNSKDFPPDVKMTRAELEVRYCISRLVHETHMAWLADAARSVLHPHNFRRIMTSLISGEWNP